MQSLYFYLPHNHRYLNFDKQQIADWTVRPNPEGRIIRKLEGRIFNHKAEMIKNEKAEFDHKAENISSLISA